MKTKRELQAESEKARGEADVTRRALVAQLDKRLTWTPWRAVPKDRGSYYRVGVFDLERGVPGVVVGYRNTETGQRDSYDIHGLEDWVKQVKGIVPAGGTYEELMLWRELSAWAEKQLQEVWDKRAARG